MKKKKNIVVVFVAALLFLTGCGSFLERDYSSVEPHSSTYYEDGSSSVLRAENYQDLVNDLLVLIGKNAQDGTIWYYTDLTKENVTDSIDRACNEVQTETAIGAYAIDYMTYITGTEGRNYIQIDLTIGYRRTSDQIASIIHITNINAIGDLLSAAAANNGDELVFQIAYFDGKYTETMETVQQVWTNAGEDHSAENMPWKVNFYPNENNAEIIEIILKEENTSGTENIN